MANGKRSRRRRPLESQCQPHGVEVVDVLHGTCPSNSNNDSGTALRPDPSVVKLLLMSSATLMC